MNTNYLKDFMPYEQALELKEIGFDESCFGWYSKDGTFYEGKMTIHQGLLSAPTFSQAFRWFREKHNLKSCIMFRTSMEDNKEYYDWLIKGQEVVYRRFNTYEEAELECLIKLIEIVKTKP
jgi:hypothetical protein